MDLTNKVLTGEQRQDPVADQWAAGQVGRDDLDSEGYTDSDGWNDVTGRKNFRRTVSKCCVRPCTRRKFPLSYALKNHGLRKWDPGRRAT